MSSINLPFEKNVAFVICNANYDNDIPTLKTPINDAELVAQTLKVQGFDVMLETDLTADGIYALFRTKYFSASHH